MHAIVVGRPWVQSGYSSAIGIADVQVVIADHVTAERVARGHVQEITFCAAYAVPSRHEAAARRQCRRNSFDTRGNVIRTRKLDQFWQPRPRLVRRSTRL